MYCQVEAEQSSTKFLNDYPGVACMSLVRLLNSPDVNPIDVDGKQTILTEKLGCSLLRWFSKFTPILSKELSSTNQDVEFVLIGGKALEIVMNGPEELDASSDVDIMVWIGGSSAADMRKMLQFAFQSKNVQDYLNQDDIDVFEIYSMMDVDRQYRSHLRLQFPNGQLDLITPWAMKNDNQVLDLGSSLQRFAQASVGYRVDEHHLSLIYANQSIADVHKQSPYIVMDFSEFLANHPVDYISTAMRWYRDRVTKPNIAYSLISERYLKMFLDHFKYGYEHLSDQEILQVNQALHCSLESCFDKACMIGKGKELLLLLAESNFFDVFFPIGKAVTLDSFIGSQSEGIRILDGLERQYQAGKIDEPGYSFKHIKQVFQQLDSHNRVPSFSQFLENLNIQRNDWHLDFAKNLIIKKAILEQYIRLDVDNSYICEYTQSDLQINDLMTVLIDNRKGDNELDSGMQYSSEILRSSILTYFEQLSVQQLNVIKWIHGDNLESPDSIDYAYDQILLLYTRGDFENMIHYVDHKLKTLSDMVKNHVDIELNAQNPDFKNVEIEFLNHAVFKRYFSTEFATFYWYMFKDYLNPVGVSQALKRSSGQLPSEVVDVDFDNTKERLFYMQDVVISVMSLHTEKLRGYHDEVKDKIRNLERFSEMMDNLKTRFQN